MTATFIIHYGTSSINWKFRKLKYKTDVTYTLFTKLNLLIMLINHETYLVSISKSGIEMYRDLRKCQM